jgi:hypothetical protein
VIVTSKITNKFLVKSLLGSQRQPSKQSKAVNGIQISCHVGGHRKGLKPLINLQKKLAKTARNMARHSMSHSREALRKKWQSVK